jgi:hypothetical protein
MSASQTINRVSLRPAEAPQSAAELCVPIALLNEMCSYVHSSNAVLAKFGLTTLLMVVAPLATYYLSLKHYFGTNTTGAAISAAVAANVVLVGFIVVAMQEDGKADEKKEQ